MLQEGRLRFEFKDAMSAFKFDEQDRSEPTFHGLSHCMKAVDFVVEYADHYLFVEIKDPADPNRYGVESGKTELVRNLASKFRNSFLYRWAEKKVDKPIRYQCLVELDNALTLYLMKQLKNQLPVDKQPTRWQRPLAQLCTVSNRETWNRNFPNIQVNRVMGAVA